MYDAITWWHVQLAPALGSYLLSSQLTGSLYDREAAMQGSSDHQCGGSACFRCLIRPLCRAVWLRLLHGRCPQTVACAFVCAWR